VYMLKSLQEKLCVYVLVSVYVSVSLGLSVGVGVGVGVSVSVSVSLCERVYSMFVYLVSVRLSSLYF